MGDAARHLPECAQTFLLHDGLLRLAQLIIGALQGTVELRLMSSQGDVLTQLAQEFALAAAETLCFAAGDKEEAKDLALHQERCCNQRAQPTARQVLRK